MENSNRIIYQKTKKQSATAENGFSDFVGVYFDYQEDKNGKIIIHYPKSLGDLPLENHKENKKLLLNLIKSLKLSKKADADDNIYGNRINNINLDKYPLYSYLWIWDDFKKHGRLLFNESINNNVPSGRINWKKTFQGGSIIYQDNVIYNDYVYRKKKEKEDLLTEIYDYCVYKSLEMIFFITNLSHNIIHPLYKDISKRRNEYINCLRDSIESTFDDEKKLRYRHMLSIISSSSFDSLINKNVIGVSSYAGVFEKQIDSMLGRVDDISHFYPKAYIVEDGETEPKRLGNLRPDTINIDGDKCFIIDSKFYEFGNMPAAESVEKQIVYGENIEQKGTFSANNIFNIFLIPRSFKEEGLNPDDVIKYHGYSYSEWKKSDKHYEKIYIFFIDLQYVINNYKNGYNSILFGKLKKEVMSRIQ